MKRFWYSIVDDEIKALNGEIENIPSGFIELDDSLGADRLYYRIQDGKITDAIGEGVHEEAARRRVQELISALNVNLL